MPVYWFGGLLMVVLAMLLIATLMLVRRAFAQNAALGFGILSFPIVLILLCFYELSRN